MSSIELVITYGVYIITKGGVSRERVGYQRGYLSSVYERTRGPLLIPGIFLHARDRLDSISTAVIVAAVIYIRAWDRPYPSLGSFCKVSVLMWYVWRVEMRQIIINL